MNDNKFVVSRGKKPTPETSVVSIRMQNKMIKQLDDVANKTARSRNEIVLMCIEYALLNLEISESEEAENK